LRQLALASLATLLVGAVFLPTGPVSAQDVPAPPGGYGAPPPDAPPEPVPDEETPGGWQAPGSDALAAPEGYGRVEALVPADEALVHVLPVGETPLRLHLRSLDGGPDPAPCSAPCTIRVTPGLYELSVQPRGGGPNLADHNPFSLDPGRQAITMTYDHRSALRVLGWVFFSLAATTMALSAPWGPIIAAVIGAPIAAAFLIPFFPLAFLQDSARVQVITLPNQ